MSSASILPRARASTLVTVLLLAACARGGDQTVANACTDSLTVDTTGWVRRTAPGSQATVLLPPSFTVDSAATFGLSGTRWRDGSRTFDEENGYWDSTAFRPRRGEGQSQQVRCYLELDGRRTLLTTTLVGDEFSATAWPVAPPADSDRVTPALVARGTTRGDQERFIRALRSVRWRDPSAAPADSAPR